MEDVLQSVRLVRDPRVVAEATEHLHLIRSKARLHSERAFGPALTGEAVTDGDRTRIALDAQTKLPAVTGGLAGGHGRETYSCVTPARSEQGRSGRNGVRS